MRSWQFHEFGQIDKLQMEDVDIPTPTGDEVLVKMKYAGLNPADKFLIMGLYQGCAEPSYSVGKDGCGEVIQTPEGSKFKAGDLVITPSATVGINRDGTLAEYLSLPEDHFALLPSWWSPEEGAAGTKVFLTCWQALSDAAHLQPDETVLVTGASGGIGLAALAIAKEMGATTIAVSRGVKKAAQLKKLGADCVLDTEDPDIVANVKELGGADVILDIVGGDFLSKCIDMANPYGRICIIGALAGINCEISPVGIIFKRLQIHGMQVSMYKADESQRSLKELLAVLEPNKVALKIDKIFPFEEVQEAFEYMRYGPLGKVLIGPIDE